MRTRPHASATGVGVVAPAAAVRCAAAGHLAAAPRRRRGSARRLRRRATPRPRRPAATCPAPGRAQAPPAPPPVSQLPSPSRGARRSEAGGRSACFAALGTTAALVAPTRPRSRGRVRSCGGASTRSTPRAAASARTPSFVRLNRSPDGPSGGPAPDRGARGGAAGRRHHRRRRRPHGGRALRALGYDRDFAARRRARRRARARVRARGRLARRGLDPARRRVRLPRRRAARPGGHRQGAARPTGRRAPRRRDRAWATLVSLGGDIAIAGRAPAGGWAVRVPRTTAGPTRPGETVAAAGAAWPRRARRCAAGGAGGAALHHIVDPRTGPAGGRGLAHGDASPRRAAWTRTSPARPRSSAGEARAPAWLAAPACRAAGRRGRRRRCCGGALAGGDAMTRLAHGNALWFLMRGQRRRSPWCCSPASWRSGIATAGRRAGSARCRASGPWACTARCPCSPWSSLGVHIATAVADPYAAVRLVDVFAAVRGAPYRPLLVGLGALSRRPRCWRSSSPACCGRASAGGPGAPSTGPPTRPGRWRSCTRIGIGSDRGPSGCACWRSARSPCVRSRRGWRPCCGARRDAEVAAAAGPSRAGRGPPRARGLAARRTAPRLPRRGLARLLAAAGRTARGRSGRRRAAGGADRRGGARAG